MVLRSCRTNVPLMMASLPFLTIFMRQISWATLHCVSEVMVSFKKKDYMSIARTDKHEPVFLISMDCGMHPSCKALLALQKLM